MKSLVSLFVISALIFAMILPPRARAQEGGMNTTAELQTLVDSVWDASATFRARIESRHNVTITKDHPMRALQAIYPKTMKYVLDRAQRRWGIQMVELDGGAVLVTTGNHLPSGGMAKATLPVPIVIAALLFVWGLIQLNQFMDDYLEDIMVQECMGEGYSQESCQQEANDLTDEVRTATEPTCYIPGAPCIGKILNEIERIREHRLPRREPLHPPGMMRMPLPAGMSPYEVGRYPCPGGSNVHVNTPTSPQSPAGSNGTEGTIDGGTITVTTSPLPCT